MDFDKEVKVVIKFDGFNLEFNAWRCNTTKGEVLREKSFCKEDRDLYYLCLLEPCNMLCLQRDALTVNFAIKEGDIKNAVGEYKVSWMGHDGFISVIELS